MLDIKNLFFNTSDYNLKEKKVGEGNFSQVYIAENKKTLKKYALKIIKTGSEFDGDKQMRLMQESLIHHQLNHPAILKFYGVNFQSFNESKKIEPSILTEFLPNGTLRENINNERISLAKIGWDPTKKYINLLGISHAMKYLHEQKIIHRDLKPENILSDENFYPHICDFGFSRYCSEIEKLKMTKKIGTRLYMAPELFDDDDVYGKSVDVYAFSMIVFEIITRKMPFIELDEKVLKNEDKFFKEIKNGYRPPIPDFVPIKMKHLIMKCWDADPNKRPSFKIIFNELSSDFESYIDEYVDNDEIKAYLEVLEEAYEGKMKAKDEDEVKKNNNKSKKTKKNNEYEIKDNKTTDEIFFKGLHQLILKDDEKDKKEAISYIKDASEKGNSYSSAFLGILYEKGIVLKQDFKKAEKYYAESSLPNCTWGLERLENCYANGYGVNVDKNKAEQYSKLADRVRFDPMLLQSLGKCYENGEKYELNYHKAFEYYKRSFLNGNIEALINIGHLYEKGYGVKQNSSMAIMYYERASRLGSKKAKTILEDKEKQNVFY